MMDGQEDGAPPEYDNFKFSASGELSQNHEVLVEKLDEIEILVEKLRGSASELEEQREALTKSLTDISESTNGSLLTAGHKEELETNVNRLLLRLLAVTIKVDIPRNSEQQEAYNKVKALLNDLQNKVGSGLDEYRKLLESYLNACSPDQCGPVDNKFQQLILACTVDDQKQVRKLLNNWLKVFHELHEQWIEACKKNMKLL